MNKKNAGNKKLGTQENLPTQEVIRNTLLETRKRQGISQAELAANVGLTRQAVYAIEVNQYLPSTQIALRLARVLKCRVEDLFSLRDGEQVIEAEFLSVSSSLVQPMRVKLSQVGSRMLARPMVELGDVLNFVMPADGVVLESSPNISGRKSRHVHVKLLNSPEVINQGILIAGCDPALFLAGEHVRKIQAVGEVTNWTMGSANALRALQRGEVHMAGVHLVDAKSGQSNVPYLKRHMRGHEFVGVHFASWVQGLLVRSGNPKKIRGIEDLAKHGRRLVNREVGAGARFLLDGRLQEAGIIGETIKGYTHEVASPLDVARLIRDGMADAGIGLEAVARHYGLEFIPLREEQYDLIMRADLLKSHPMMAKFLDAVVSRPFRQEIEALGGYNLTKVGKTLSW